MKVLGLIGTLDPYKHKLNLGSIEDVSLTDEESKAKNEIGKLNSFTHLIFLSHL